MNKHSILFIGLDTHKEFNEVAYIEEHRGAQPVHLGRFSSSKKTTNMTPTLIKQAKAKFLYLFYRLIIYALRLRYFRLIQ